MLEKKTIHIITFAFLALMLFKVSSFHVYTHQETASDQIENCKICDSAIENQDTEFLTNTFEGFDIPQNFLFEEKNLFKVQQSRTSIKLHFRLFGRPPPTA